VDCGHDGFDRFEIINPLVKESVDLAVLTLYYISSIGDKQLHWNCTEVYRRDSEKRWLIIQPHYSFTNIFKYYKSLEGSSNAGFD
jgi:hypothetical protein